MNRSMQRIAITGANGFVGGALCKVALQRGHGITAVTRSPMLDDYGVDNRVVGGMDAHTNWLSALAGCDTVIHLAAYQPSGRRFVNDLEACRRVNVEGTENLAQQAAESGVRRFVFVSSVKVHGETSAPTRPFIETDLASPLSPYAISKWEAERRLFEITAATKMEIVIVRPPLVYGNGVQGNLKSLIQLVKLGIPLPLARVFNQRSMVSMTNLVDFLLLCCTHPAAVSEVFFVSDGEDLSVPELLARLGTNLGTAVRLVPAPVWTLETIANVLGSRNRLDKLCGNLQVDISKSQLQLGWRPVETPDEGLRQIFTDSKR